MTKQVAVGIGPGRRRAACKSRKRQRPRGRPRHHRKQPERYTLGQWLELWAADYLGHVKPGTASTYTINIRNHICPALGNVPLNELHPHLVQQFINSLTGLSAGSVRLIYKILHMALEKAVQLGYLPQNPAAHCVLPRAEQKEIRPLTDEESAALLAAAAGTRLETLVCTALFTGMRLSELLGLTWDCVDWRAGTILVNKQLALPAHRTSGLFLSPKNGKSRTIVPASAVLDALKHHQAAQNFPRAGLVFTMPDGGPVDQWRARRWFHELLDAAGLSGVRFHDLRHTYAVNALRAGDDIKTVQSNLGHSSAAFTLDRYGHFTEPMRRDSARRMEAFMHDVMGL